MRVPREGRIKKFATLRGGSLRMVGMKEEGSVIIPSGVNVWPHELETAKALASAGKCVEFVRRNEGEHEKSADFLMGGELWEMKSPNGSSMKTVERNLRKACEQSRLVVFDSRRLKGIPDSAVERELRTCAEKRLTKLDRLIFVNKRRSVIEIK